MVDIKRDIYKDGKQYCSHDELWEAVQDAAQHLDKEDIKKLTKSVDTRLCCVIEKKGGYIGH